MAPLYFGIIATGRAILAPEAAGADLGRKINGAQLMRSHRSCTWQGARRVIDTAGRARDRRRTNHGALLARREDPGP